MISRIKLEKVATFKNKVEIEPSSVNYFYGFNGSGKTTISNVLQNPSLFSDCSVDQDSGDREILVYNKDFIDANFTDSTKIKGVFTLGKDAGEALTIIEKSKAKLDEVTKKKNSKLTLKAEKEKEILDLDKKLDEECWKKKSLYADTFKEALLGKIGKKEEFKNACLSTILKKEELKTIDVLQKEYELLYKTNLDTIIAISPVNYNESIKKESNVLFSKEIKGSDSLTVSELINFLDNADWVKQGLGYLNIEKDKCPFCQKTLLKDEVQDISNYFNVEYEEDCKKLISIVDNYKKELQDILTTLEDMMTFNYLKDKKEFENKILELKNIVDKNYNLMEDKIKNPSKVITVNSTEEAFKDINTIVNDVNKEIAEKNATIKDKANAKFKLQSNIWNFFANELESVIAVYNSEKNNIYKAIVNFKKETAECIEQENNLKKIINNKENEITGITQTLNDINHVLILFGFKGFKLVEAEEKGTYKIVREDGRNVGKTLSEGEYRFISFLYFYYLINGSTESTGVIKNRIIVIDDPICSLDSNTLFIISTLVKDIIANCFEKKNGVEQVFVLTHNVYFYKEILFRGARNNKKSCEKYYVVNKKDEISNITLYDKNPIHTTYQLLWAELQLEIKNKATIYNTMRRILEYYFNYIGNRDYEKMINEFEGNEKLISKSLLSCINDSSHYISDEIEVNFDEDIIDKYLTVFKKIFDKLGHINHYNMMMNEEE
ncbi:MAG: AAA family ATPase [Bacilli bacterium]